MPAISSDFFNDVLNQLGDKNSNCGDSILAKFNNYRSYGSWPWYARRTVMYAYVLGRGRTPDFLNICVPIPKKCDLK